MQATEFFAKVRNLFPKAFREELRDEVLTQLDEFSDQQRHDGMRRLRQTKLGKQSVTMADVRLAIEGKASLPAAQQQPMSGEFTYAAAFRDWLRPDKNDRVRLDAYNALERYDQVRVSRLAACLMMETPSWQERMEQIGGAGTLRECFERMAAFACQQPCCDTDSPGGWFPGRPVVEVHDEAPQRSQAPEGELAIRAEMSELAAKLKRPPIWPRRHKDQDPWEIEKEPVPVSQAGASDALKALVAKQRGIA